MNHEKRIHARRSIQSEAYAADHQENAWQSVCLLDISVGGIAFVSREKMAVGDSCAFRLHMPGTARLMKVTACITHCNEHTFLSGYRIGARFTSVAYEDLMTIEQFVEEAAPVTA